MNSFQVKARLVDIQGRRIFPARIEVDNGRITNIIELKNDEHLEGYILPGFIDSHVHIETGSKYGNGYYENGGDAGKWMVCESKKCWKF